MRPDFGEQQLKLSVTDEQFYYYASPRTLIQLRLDLCMNEWFSIEARNFYLNSDFESQERSPHPYGLATKLFVSMIHTDTNQEIYFRYKIFV